MKRKAISCLLAGSVLLSCVSCAAPSASQEQAAGKGTAENPFVEKVHALIDEPEMEYWPASRWWLAEGLHTDETIKKSVKELYEILFPPLKKRITGGSLQKIFSRQSLCRSKIRPLSKEILYKIKS